MDKGIEDLLKRLASAKISRSAMALLVGGGLLAYTAMHSYFVVEAGRRAIMYNRLTGVGSKIYIEGLQFKIPWLEHPIIYDIRARPYQNRTLTGSFDLQTVEVALRVLCRPDSNQLQKIYRTLGYNWEQRVLPSITNEVMKAVVAKFTASQLITKRQEVSKMIQKSLIDRARDFDIVLDDVAITELSFSPVYTAAVEAKQVAQQEAQRASFIVERAKMIRQEKIVQAEGEAQVATMLGEAMTGDKNYLHLRKIRAGQRIAKIIGESSANRGVYIPSSGLMFDLGSKDYFEHTPDFVIGVQK